MMADTGMDATESLALLEERLRRVDFVLNGSSALHAEDVDSGPKHTPDFSAAAHLRSLERGLQALAWKSSFVTDVLALQKQHPDLFQDNPSSEVLTTLPLPGLASLIVAHSSLYRNVALQLQQLQDTSIPDPAAATKLIDQRERIEKARSKQDQQIREFAELRKRSANLVESWYERGVLDMSESWASWEERLREVEILIRRKEAVKKRDDGVV